MAKKDTVVLAVLCNLIVLAAIFATAHQIKSSNDPICAIPAKTEAIKQPEKIAYDEIDQILEEYLPDKKKVCEEYTVCAGDNPWKIAKKCNISYEQLLSLNNLDQEAAKNIQIGQKLRIRDPHEK